MQSIIDKPEVFVLADAYDEALETQPPIPFAQWDEVLYGPVEERAADGIAEDVAIVQAIAVTDRALWAWMPDVGGFYAAALPVSGVDRISIHDLRERHPEVAEAFARRGV